MSKIMMSEDSIDRLIADQNAMADVHTGGMIALVPRAEDAERLALPGWEPADVLHVTLAFLGPGHEVPAKGGFIEVANELSNLIFKIDGNVWAAASFNPTGDEPCAVYLVGGTGLATAKRNLDAKLSQRQMAGFLPPQHQPWVPHITIGYDLNVSELREFGPIQFDRIRVAFGDENVTDFDLM